MKPIVWSIAGFDSSNGAGLSADLNVFTQLGVHGCGVTTAITAQNAHAIHAVNCLSSNIIAAQLSALDERMPAQAIKIGMLGNFAAMQTVQHFLSSYHGHVIWDPVLFSTSGKPLFVDDLALYRDFLRKMLPLITLFTPNKLETELLLNRSINTTAAIENAALELLDLGAQSVCIKGGHFFNPSMSHDYWSNDKESFWLSNKRYPEKNYRGTGCAFSAAITAALAAGYRLQDAIVLAKMYISRGIRLADALDATTALLHHGSLPDAGCDLPYLSQQPVLCEPSPFNRCEPIGLYPIVDNAEWVERLCRAGVKTLQLRIKHQTNAFLHTHLQQSIRTAAQYGVRLYINDYWELALHYGAYGVHLGQEDLGKMDVARVFASGLRLGISTHCHAEVARAHTLRPSYLACGPIFATTSKIMPFAPQGPQQLAYWRAMLPHYPWVAIGGINETNIASVLAAGVKNIAMISAITHAANPEAMTRRLLKYFPESEPVCS